MNILVNEMQSSKALSKISTKFWCNLICTSEQHPLQKPWGITVIGEFSSNEIFNNFLQSLKTSDRIELTDEGIKISESDSQL